MNLDQTIYDVAIRNGFSPATSKLIVAQARFESGNYKSNVFKQNNNLFGMKFVAQPLATRGTLAPSNERSSVDRNTNYYAKYKNPEDSVKDVVERLYSKTIGGVTQLQLQNAQTSLDFAKLLKLRGYYGGTPEEYSNGLKSRLRVIQVNEIADDIRNMVVKNRDIIEVAVLMVIITSAYLILNK
jgi:uncharacterized FlgJ-related protein